MGLDLEPWEPEETVGKLWHAWASGFDAPQDFAEQSVALPEVAGRITVLFRGLGGAPSVEIRPAAIQTSHHRIGWRRMNRKQEVGYPGFFNPGNQFRLFIIDSQIMNFKIMQRLYLNIPHIHLDAKHFRRHPACTLPCLLHERMSLHIIPKPAQSQNNHHQDSRQYFDYSPLH
mgnify:CR=1 FL=1